jgi:FMN-dependent NADH-azoreductase
MSQKHNFRLGLIKEITSADEILISTPMWNWSVPSLLKAYIDQIIVGGVLDGSGAAGLAGKKVTFVVAQGGSYKDGAPRAGWDFATGYLELVAKALGATDIQTILAEFTLAGNAPGMESLVDAKNASVASAKNAARKRAA